MPKLTQQIQRLWSLLEAISLHPECVSLDTLACCPDLLRHYTDVNSRQRRQAIADDLARLQALWPEWFHAEVPESHFSRSLKGASEFINREAALALVMSSGFMEQSLPPHVYQAVQPLLKLAEQRLEHATTLRHWSQRVRFVFDGPFQAPLTPANAVADLICKAILNRDAVEIDYRRESDDTKRQYRIVPQGMIIRGRRRLLISRQLESGWVTTFALHRVDEARLLPLEELAGDLRRVDLFDAVEQVQYERARRDQPIKLVLWIDQRLVHQLQESPLAEDQTLLSDSFRNGYRLTATCLWTDSLFWWLYQHKHELIVLAPQDLHDALEAHHQLARLNQADYPTESLITTQ